MPPTRQNPAKTFLFLIQWLIFGMALLILGGGIGYSITREYKRIEARERERLATQAKVIDANLGNQLSAANLALFAIRRKLPLWKTQKDGMALANQSLRAMSDVMPGLRTFLIMDAEGRIVAASRDELIGRNFSDRDYFKTPRQHADPAMFYISPPFKTVLGVFAMNVGCAITGPNGEFAGIVGATIDPEYITVLLGSVRYTRDMWVVLAHGDGKLFLMVPEREGTLGMDLATPGSFFSRHRESGRTTSMLTGIVTPTGEEGLISQRTVRPANVPMDKPLVVAVGRDLAAIYATWRRDVSIQGGLFGLLAMTTALGLLLYQRRQRDYDRRAASYVAKLSETVSELQRAEKASRESEERFRSIVDTASDGILIARVSTRKFVEANVAICEMLGYTRDELLRLGLEDIHAAPDLSDVIADFDKLSRAEKRTSEGVPVMRKDGSIFHADISANPVEFEGERHLVGIFRDITVRKRAEEDREHLQAQLHQAMKMEAVGCLAGGVAHDFNNLLTVINGYSELLIQRLGEKSPMRKDVEEILRAGNQAGALTRQLLVFSRKQVLQPKVVDLNVVVSKTGEMLRRLIGENIEFRTVLAEGLGRVKADAGQIEQILLNLAINARDAMPGGGELTIETADVVLGETFAKDHPSLIPGPHVLLSVGDTGSGIPDEIQGHIFEPFFTTKGLGKGTGLGLATVYGIIQQSQGHLDFHTEMGKGTTFRIYLPRVDAESEALSTVPTAAPQGSETVLVVEDEHSVREIINRVLSGKGYRVLMASDGSEGLRVSGEYKGPIDLLLTDLVMPGMGGREFATRLEAGRAGMRVLFMSGYTEDVISHQGLLEAGLSFIQKPFTSGDLLRKVREVLDGEE